MKKKRNIIEIIQHGFLGWCHNPMIILVYLFTSILTTLVSVAALLVSFKLMGMSFVDFAMNRMTQEQVAQTMLTALSSPSTFGYLVLFGFIFGIIYLLVISYFGSGSIGMALNYFRTRRIQNLQDMHNYGKKFMARSFFLFLIIALFFIIILGLFALPLVLTNAAAWSIFLFTLIFLALIVFLFFLILSSYCLVSYDSNIWQAISRSIKITGKNFWAALGLFVLIGIISALIQLIPYAGSIITALIISPVMTFCYVLFVEERKI